MNDDLIGNLIDALYDVSEKLNSLNHRLDRLDDFKEDMSRDMNKLKQSIEYLQGAIEERL